MRLSELKSGESGVILKVRGHGGFRRRIMEMGFVRGKRVEVILNAPLQDPIEYKIMGYAISLRRSEAAMVEVISEEEAQQLSLQENFGSTEADLLEEAYSRKSKHISVALVGNPNSGKTSIFNAISGSHEHVGNYSGVTVDAKRGHCTYRGYKFEITDLPGTYALSAYTPEELYVRHHIEENTPDVVVNSVVASNLERNLYLTTELIDMNPRMVVALNMFDELEHRGAQLDYDSLGRMMGVPMVPVVARTGRGIEALLDTIIAVYENEDDRVRHIHINQGSVIEEALGVLNEELKRHNEQLPKVYPPRYLAMKLLERDKDIEKVLRDYPDYPVWAEMRDREAKRVEELLGVDLETAFAERKYGFVSGALKETYAEGEGDNATVAKAIDTIVTHKVWGYPVFLLMMWLMFYCTFSLGTYPQGWIESAVEWFSRLISSIMPDGTLKDLVVDGVIGGVGSVIVFLPNIMILYLFISFMEDSGYLARAAFIMDKVMHRIGLHGKSFIPLVMGFGCNVPAVLSCRTIESRSSRLITILITPFMSCSARLPIYILFAGAFFPRRAGLVLFGLYVAGILMAMLTARLMRRFMFKKDETPFVMELPPYRVPTLKTTLIHMWDKCAQYLRKMGGLILIASVVVWFLSYFPRSEESATKAEHYENSYLGRVGKACEPVFAPLGFNWKSNVALLSGVAAKEIVVSTLGVLYTDGEEEVQPENLLEESADNGQTLRHRLAASGDFDTATALAFLLFILIYFPCIATVMAISAELGWKWAVGSILYSTTMAWIVAYAAYHLINLFV